VIALAENTLRHFDKLAARNRSMCLLAKTLDKLQAEWPLKLADLQADRWLRQV
jgi:hypothetical protein